MITQTEKKGAFIIVSLLLAIIAWGINGVYGIYLLSHVGAPTGLWIVWGLQYTMSITLMVLRETLKQFDK